MTLQNQQETIAFLSSAEVYDSEGPVDREETHISEIFLTPDRAYKLKRAVKLPYADFSTAGKRLAMCEREIELNRRTAPDLYLGVRRITREAGGELAFDGDGPLVDAVVEMRRFDENDLFDRMAGEGRLMREMMAWTSDAIAEFHEDAEVFENAGGAANIEAVLDINESGFQTSHVFADEEVEALNKAFREAHAALSRRLDLRGREGRIRRGHGDLHLRNIFLFEGKPALFDCIEFNEDIATLDVLYDVAFLVMDLWHRGNRDFANLVANRYLDRTGNDDGFVLMPFFMAVRAAVRAHVTATQIEEASDTGENAKLERQARSYFDLATELLQPGEARVVAIGGLSGTGKSTVAEALAPQVGRPPGARIIESDRTRKALFGVAPEDHLPQSAYSAEVSEEVYGRMAASVEGLAGDGCAVIADAVFADPAHRQAVADAARGAGVPFAGIWLDASPEVLKERVTKRRGSASDADLAILEKQMAATQAPEDWVHVDAGGEVEAVVGEIRGKL